ncbi:nuclear factor 7, ovary-like [Scleropages formosus]|nr:E3 ubiquitin-protein ligase TRIM39-like isoform X2 [Scleropages formosus]XP_018585763.1 E3 ubiquitin-protein ligase TRIM39-like isoform X2 [Scleropages formosus]XP_018585764.1 E3 ubiquitin-protein ligase TRIM39-like isoform X2 [Scleropages formosus]XP_018585765.1 E3 ubiquitin-protein ligase TRIM39-like isoform X2 [Scleropages formosus]XP_018585766.1 E3 ubiquitin-protein ligase TRIM39-like isoform X2 [Scleropages formosus]KPP63814.1 nuclear factor 7, ovary-like [Scleropages formosus]
MAESSNAKIPLADDPDMSPQWGRGPPAIASLGKQASGLRAPSPTPASAEMTGQPYARSPRAMRKVITAGGTQAKELLSRHLEELEEEQARAEAHLQSLKKRSTNLARSAEAMKLQVSERYESMRRVLQKDEEATLDAVEQEHREANMRLTDVLRDWKQHLSQLQRDIASTRRALEPKRDAQDCSWDFSCPKKKEAAKEEITMNEDRFHKLLKILRSVCNKLEAQLQRKSFMLDASAVEIDRHSCHRHITVSGGGRRLCFSTEAKPAPVLPLQFDKVYCGLASRGITASRCYWEVDVRCCTAWAVGAAYGRLERKGKVKGAELGRNAHSWCLELHSGALSAWHNDRCVTCRPAGTEPPRKVGILLDRSKGRLAFYDLGSVKLLHEFSTAWTPGFDRTQPQFAEALFPAFRFLKPEGAEPWPSHMEICTPML